MPRRAISARSSLFTRCPLGFRLHRRRRPHSPKVRSNSWVITGLDRVLEIVDNPEHEAERKQLLAELAEIDGSAGGVSTAPADIFADRRRAIEGRLDELGPEPPGSGGGDATPEPKIWGVWCAASSGIPGRREAWLRDDDQIARFTEAEARAKADELNRRAQTPGRIAGATVFHYSAWRFDD
jgi:hypothetical protein